MFILLARIQKFVISLHYLLLKELEKQWFLSAPIIDGNLRPIGIVDVLDIALFVTSLFPATTALEKITSIQIQEAGKKFDATPICEVLGR